MTNNKHRDFVMSFSRLICVKLIALAGAQTTEPSMRFLKMKPATVIVLSGAFVLSAVSLAAAVASTKLLHKTHHAHRLAIAAAPQQQAWQWEAPKNCGMRYYGGPKGGLWPAPCPGK
jgi:hypothetical protein